MQLTKENVVTLSAISLNKVITEWRDLLGSEHVLTDEAAQAYNNCPSQTVRHIPAVLRPESQVQVQEIVRIAAQHHICLHPVSTGRNWGFGGASPAVNSAVIVDLSRMNRILDFMADLGVITIEPGVTQRQLAEFLEQGNYPFMISASSASPNCSVIGNALERGHGLMPYVDRFLSLTSLKAILPDGQLFQSLLADGGGDIIDKTYKWGAGPYLDGLFSQGGFGIVTQASFILAPKVEQTTMFLLTPRSDVNLDQLLNRLRQVKHNAGHMISTFELGTRTGGLDGDAASITWSITGGIHASREMSKFIIRMMRRDLRDLITDCIFLTRDTVDQVAARRFWQRDTELKKYARDNIDLMKGMLDFYQGIPQDKAMTYAYHHLPDRLQGDETLPSLETNLRNTGLIWYWPILPARGADVRLFLEMMKRVSAKHGFNPVWNFNLEHSTYISAGVHIFYDPETEQTRAMDFYRELFEEGKALGYLPHRAHIESGPLYPKDGQDHYFSLLNRLKQGVDPHGIISMRLPTSKYLDQKSS